MSMGPLTSGRIDLDRPKTTASPAVYTGPTKLIPEEERFNRKVRLTFTMSIDIDTNDVFGTTPEGTTDQAVLDKIVANATRTDKGPSVPDIYDVYETAGCFDAPGTYTASVTVNTVPLFDLSSVRGRGESILTHTNLSQDPH